MEVLPPPSEREAERASMIAVNIFNGKIALGLQSKNDEYSFLKGGVEDEDETALDTAFREAKEEAGLDRSQFRDGSEDGVEEVGVFDRTSEFTDKTSGVAYFIGSVACRPLPLEPEGGDIVVKADWFTFDEALEKLHNETDKQVLRALREQIEARRTGGREYRYATQT